ncbi:HI0074 family nucleotidyltransferase substrate-binding subunit [Rhodopila globiformis]|uniref:Nucleotidyltransferase n=1 Tax=Rhodopila globiformis TaxID=1071 RepID=A0A2S6NKN7_RHOGL|nr:HI0074 family nucleotidyltransferase substrate-binding subunit [Rhodopila globiformis]PPQ35600.1 nucleotidyltransferase [Rhodopila globiformis]
MDIDISPLARAIERLEEGVAVYQRDTSQTLIRDGLVQRFEFTYEISHKLLRRYLAANPGPPELISGMNFADIIRLGNEQGLLLGDWRRWKTFRDMRARTSHSYDEAVALEVVAGIPAFLDEARVLRDRLRARLAP